MRIAAFVIGLIASLLMFGQSFMISGVSSLISNFSENGEEVQQMILGAGIGFISSILGIIGASLAFKYCLASGVILFISAFLCFLGGALTIYKDLIVWGVMLLISGIFSFAANNAKSTKNIETGAN